MNESTSTALVPVSTGTKRDDGKGGSCGDRRSLLAGRSKWLLLAAALLAVAALVLGSSLLGVAALLPLLYLLPCLIMVGMCMRMHARSDGSNDSGRA